MVKEIKVRGGEGLCTHTYYRNLPYLQLDMKQPTGCHSTTGLTRGRYHIEINDYMLRILMTYKSAVTTCKCHVFWLPTNYAQSPEIFGDNQLTNSFWSTNSFLAMPSAVTIYQAEVWTGRNFRTSPGPISIWLKPEVCFHVCFPYPTQARLLFSPA